MFSVIPFERMRELDFVLETDGILQDIIARKKSPKLIKDLSSAAHLLLGGKAATQQAALYWNMGLYNLARHHDAISAAMMGVQSDEGTSDDVVLNAWVEQRSRPTSTQRRSRIFDALLDERQLANVNKMRRALTSDTRLESLSTN